MAQKPNATIAEALEDKKNKIFETTPQGTAVFPHLIKADPYQLKENNKIECNTQLRLDPNDDGVTEFFEKLDTYSQEAYDVSLEMLKAKLSTVKGKDLKKLKEVIAGLQKHTPYEEDCDEEGNDTGKFVIKTKTTVGGVDKKTKKRWSKEVPLYDGLRKKIVGKTRATLKLWGGSEILLSLQINPFCAEGLKLAGISLRIVAVQVVSIPDSAASAESYGFGMETGGFDSSSTADEEDFDTDGEGGDTHDAEGSDGPAEEEEF